MRHIGWRVGATSVGLVLWMLVSGCGPARPVHDGRLSVVASFYPLAEAAAHVGGDRVNVTDLTPAGVEPHDLELTSRQVDRIEDADLVVYAGKRFQPAVGAVASRQRRGVDVLAGIDAGRGDAFDPHFWLDPTLMVRAVGEIARGLTAAAPGDAERFRRNASVFAAQLRALDTEYRQGLSRCDRREVVTAHAAFSYLARRYHLTQIAIAGVSPDAEPDAGKVAKLAARIRAGGITTVFFEELVSPKIARALAREAGVRVAVLSPLEGLPKAGAASKRSYVSVMRDNLRALRLALGCR